MKPFQIFFIGAFVVGIGTSAHAQCTAPYSIPKFQAAIAECKLQAPDSGTEATQAQLIGGYCSDWFKVANTDKMAFNQTGDSMRTELRYLNNWFINAQDRTAHASINIVTQTCDQVTVMQIHDDAGAGPGPNKPLLRIYRHQNKSPVNHIWAAIKTDSGGVNTEHVDLGLTPAGYWDCDIVISGGNMSVAINGTTLVTRDVSFWTFPSYWKAGVYLQDPGEATAYFDELTWTEQYTLTTNVIGQGSIGLSPAGGTYDDETVVTVTATPDAGWQFDGWSGDLTGSSNPDTITMDADKTVTATFSMTAGNQPPAFTSDPINEIPATEGVPYSGTIADDASDPEGDPMSFSKVSGPAWLTVATNGVLTGTPGAGDVGGNVFTVQVAAIGGSNTATLNITVNAAGGGGSITNCIVDDSWSSGTRTSPPNDASYWSSTSSSGNSIEVYANEMGLISGTSGRGNHAIFASQPLAVGDTLVATLTFTTPTTVGSAKSDALRFGFFDTTAHLPGLEADLTSSSSSPNTNFNNLNGYMMTLDVATGSDDVRFYERNNPGSGRLLATTTDYADLGDGPNDGYTFLANTSYTVEMSITRVAAAELSLTGSLYQGASLLSTHTLTDASATATEFGMLGMHANSSTFGSTTSSGQGVDNGLTFSNIQICHVTLAPTPPPTLGIALSGPNVILSWPTNDSSGFNLESTSSMSAPSWSPAGSPIVVGDQNQVTTPATGNSTYYRLKKP